MIHFKKPVKTPGVDTLPRTFKNMIPIENGSLTMGYDNHNLSPSRAYYDVVIRMAIAHP